MEEESIRKGEERVKFKLKREENHEEILPSNWEPLAKALTISEELGAAPICPITGQLFGNGAMIHKTSSSDNENNNSIIVSKSGRIAGTKYNASQFVKVTSFDASTWTATYNSSNVEYKPSSDTPLLWNALINAPKLYEWKKKPKFVLHGHTCSTEEEAKALDLPCSSKETLFSTPDDLDALMKLLAEYSYPDYQIYVRKNHGFFLLAETPEEAIELFKNKLSKVVVRDTVDKNKDENNNGMNQEKDEKLTKSKHDVESDDISPRKKLKTMENEHDD